MIPSLRSCFAALALGLALSPLAVCAAGPTPEIRVTRLNQLVGLSRAQEKQAADLFRREDAELDALSAGQRAQKSTEIRQDSRERVRALLTPEQQKIYDRAPGGRGGGLTLPSPESKLTRLDETVGLTADQKPIALKIFEAEFEGLLAIPPAERLTKGAVYRQTAQDQVRELLTLEQLDKMTGARNAALVQGTAEQTALVDLLRASPAIAARVGAIVSVSPGGSSSTTEGSDGSRGGSGGFRVVGATKSETFKVLWERDPATGRILAKRVEAANGDLIQL